MARVCRVWGLARDASVLVAVCFVMMAAFSTLPVRADDGFARLVGHGGPVKGVAVSGDGSHALTASFDYTIGLWDLSGPRLVRRLNAHRAAANTAAFLPGDRALTAGDDFDVLLWDLKAGQVLRTMAGHKGKILSIAVAPDAAFAITAGWDGWAGIWDLAAEAPPRWLKGHKQAVNDAEISADARWAYTASQDGTIRRWDIAAGQQDRIVVSHGFGVNHLVLDEAAGWLAYGAVDGVVRVIDLATDREIADLTADRRPILALAASPDGRRLAVGDGEGYVMIIDTRSWRIERDFHAAKRGPIWALAWTADGKRLLSGGLDDAAVLWPVAASAQALAGLLSQDDRSFLKDPKTMGNGERQFARKCSICHTLSQDGAGRAGPTLWRLFGRRAGTVAGYSYSPALLGSDIVWEAATIDGLFLEGPDHYTPGSKMPMQRITGDQDRADLIAYLAASTGPRADAQGVLNTPDTPDTPDAPDAPDAAEQTGETKP